MDGGPSKRQKTGDIDDDTPVTMNPTMGLDQNVGPLAPPPPHADAIEQNGNNTINHAATNNNNSDNNHTNSDSNNSSSNDNNNASVSTGGSKHAPLPPGVAQIQKGASWVWKHVRLLTHINDHELSKKGTHICVHPVTGGDCNTPLKLHSTGNRGAFVSTRATEHMKKHHLATWEAATAGKTQQTAAKPTWRKTTALKNSVFEVELKSGASYFNSIDDAPLCRTADGAGELSAECFTYSTGVEAVRLKNSVGKLVVLPFQGQQIWDAEFLGRRLTMKSMFTTPRKVDLNKQWGYLDTYGAFFVHCGADAMGCPGAEDEHNLHGDLPNAPYQKAHIRLGVDSRGKFIEVGGEYSHVVAFKTHYVASPSVRLYTGQSTVPITMSIKNEFHKPMDLMYMAHTNFRPVPNSEIMCSHFIHPDAVTVSPTVNGIVQPTPEYLEFIETLKKDPVLGNRLTPEVIKNFDPEIIVYLRNFAKDPEGFAHSLQILPDGSADYVKHSPDELPRVTRWILNDPSHAALGLCLPGTAEPTGKASETKKGNLRQLGAGNSQTYSIEVGAVDKTRAAEIQQVINGILEVPNTLTPTSHTPQPPPSQ